MSNSAFVRFVVNFLLYLLVVCGLAAYPLYKFADKVILEGLGASMALFFFVTLISFWLIMRKAGKDNSSMLNIFLASTGIKMVVSLVYFLVLLKSFPGREIEFAITFFAAYLICTCFEVYYLLHNLRQI